MFFTDQLGREIAIPYPPKRIVSLVPSQTELLYDLGLEKEVVGITKFCVHPSAWFHSKTRVGGTKKIHPDIIHQLQPDLIIANKEENEEPQIKELMQQFPVWTSDIHDLSDACNMIQSIGNITGKTEKTTDIITTIQSNFNSLTNTLSSLPSLNTVYFIWRDPWMVAGGDTFIHDMLQRCGCKNVFAHLTRYPAVDISQLPHNNIQLILLSSEPYPFREKHIAEIKKFIPGANILLADGEMFSWYGSRLIKAPEYFKSLLHQLF